MLDPPAVFARLPRLKKDGVDLVAGGEASVHAAARSEAVLLSLGDRALLVIEGAESTDLLQRVCSQDAENLPVGAGAPACILTGKGKLLAYFELFRVRPDLFLCEVDRAQRKPLADEVERYIFGERIELQQPSWGSVGVFGPAAADWLEDPPAGVRPFGSGYLLFSTRLGVPGYRLHGPGDEVDALARSLADDLPLGGFHDYEALRIDAGEPRYSVDADESTIPLEVGLDDACDPDKGCYIGQEIVARIRTYGHVNRKLCRVVVDTEAPPERGTLVFDEDVEAGRITSAYASPADGKVRALAFLPAVLAEAGTELRAGGANGPALRVL